MTPEAAEEIPGSSRRKRQALGAPRGRIFYTQNSLTGPQLEPGTFDQDEATGEFHGGKAIAKAVISLPADAFKRSGTGAKTSVLYVQKRHARKGDAEKLQDEPQTDVFMAVTETLCYVVKNNVEDDGAGGPNDLAAVVRAHVRGE